ncbi:hypothetical protein CcCBS67573_g07920 [Chytriomyces confervae]|uniref:Uncharacterized protein n=1 Tax=Chytriomyces confervae TaxID=246404 RepID=A0A507EPD6_9FUNG|nr:hypothetical protein CcCBS67573_g07920 [Chytriomyces confervae]
MHIPNSAMLQAIPLLLLAADHALAFDWTLSGPKNAYTSLTCTLVVPPVPQKPATGDATYFYWPGLQTNNQAANFNPIGFGVLQPVLTFGPACTPNQPKGVSVYRGWHVSAQYVNPGGPEAKHTGCMGGNMMDVSPGDNLVMSMTLTGTVWTQTVVRQGVDCSGPGDGVKGPNGCEVSFSIDMLGQGQNRAELVLELYYQAVVTSDVLFNDIRMTITNPEPSNSTRFCTPSSRLQKTETCTGMALSADGKTCTIEQCMFKAAQNPVTPPPSAGAGNGVTNEGSTVVPAQVIPPPPPPPEEELEITGGAAQTTTSSGSAKSASTNLAATNGGSTKNNGESSNGGSTSNSNQPGNTSSNTVGQNGVAGTQSGTSNSGSSASGPSKPVIFGVVGVAAVGLVAGAFVFMRNRKSKASSVTIDQLAATSPTARAEMYAVQPSPPEKEMPIKPAAAMSSSNRNPFSDVSAVSAVHIPPRSQNSRVGVDSATSYQAGLSSSTGLLAAESVNSRRSSFASGSELNASHVQPRFPVASPLAQSVSNGGSSASEEKVEIKERVSSANGRSRSAAGSRRGSTADGGESPVVIAGRVSSSNSRASPVASRTGRTSNSPRASVEIAQRGSSKSR